MVPVSLGIDLITNARLKQINEKGYSLEHDKEHDRGQLAMMAACYAAPELIYVHRKYANGVKYFDPFPFSEIYDKRPYSGNYLIQPEHYTKEKRIELLSKAGALIAAEIDRLLNTKENI